MDVDRRDGRTTAGMDRWFEPPSRFGFGDAAAFWGLVFLAMLGLVPAVVLPEWRVCEQAHLAETAWEKQVEALNEQVEYRRRLAEALRTDPAVVRRAAMQELNQLPENAIPVRVPLAFASTRMPPESTRPAIQAPRWLLTASRFLPPLNYDATFCVEPYRTVVIAMSTGLLSVALLLFGRKKIALE